MKLFLPIVPTFSNFLPLFTNSSYKAVIYILLKRCPKYDLCETNVDKFVFDVETEISNHGPNYHYHEHNFNGFVSFLQGKINENFLVDENKYFNSKRNRLLLTRGSQME